MFQVDLIYFTINFQFMSLFLFFIKNTSPVSTKSNLVDKIHFEVMYIKRNYKRNELVQDR